MKFKSGILIHFATLFFLLFIFALVYKPITQGHYFYMDDYMQIWTNPYVAFGNYIPSLGRPLSVLYLHIVFDNYINSLKYYQAANTVRIIGIIGVGLLAYVLYVIFKANKFRTDHAILLSILICTLPPFLIYLGYIICLVAIYSVLLSALSFLVLFKAVFNEHGIKKAQAVTAVPISVILFVASLCIYQSTALTYWALAIIPLMMIKNEDFVKKWYLSFIIYFSTGFVSMIIYFKSIKIYNLLLNIQLQPRGDRIQGAVNIYNRLIWFINYPLHKTLSLWQIVYYTKEVTLFVSMVIFAGILYSLSRTVKQVTLEKKGLNILLNLLCKYLLVVVVILLSYVAHLATIGSSSRGITSAAEATIRTLTALEIAVLLLFYWGLINTAEFIKTVLNFSADLQNKIVTIGLVILTVVASLLANHNVDKYLVRHLTNEYRYVKDTIQRYGVSKLSNNPTIYVKPAGRARIKGGGDIHSIYGEFYIRSSVSAMTRLALYELGIDSGITILTISNLDPETDEPIEEHDKRYKRLPEDDTSLKIDMTKMSVTETYNLIYYE